MGGQGHGQLLLEFAATEAGTLGVKALHLAVDRGNVGAQKLYDALGYQSRGRYVVMTKLSIRETSDDTR